MVRFPALGSTATNRLGVPLRVYSWSCLTAFLGEELETPAALAHWEAFLIEAVTRTVRPANEKARAPNGDRALQG